MSFATPLRFIVNRTCLLASLSIGLVAAGCSGDSRTPAECGGHGELHGDHCHCNPGYVPSSDGQTCVSRRGAGGQDAGVVADSGLHPDAGGNQGGQDASVSQDAGVAEDAGAPVGTLLDFTPPTVRGRTGAAQDGTKVWVLEAVDGDAVLGLELYEAYGAPTTPGTVDITTTETSYADCGTCLLLQTGCSAHGDHFHCARTFMPRVGGQVRLDAMGASVGEQLTGDLLDVVFQEVSIDENLQTTPVPDGQVLRLDAWAFDVSLEALQ